MINQLIVLFLLLFAFAGVQTFRLHAAQQELERDHREAAEAIAAAQAHAREVEQQWADGTRKAAETYAKNLDLAKRAALDSAAALDRLRDAAGPSAAASAPEPAPGTDEATRARYVVGQLAGAAAKVAAAADECEARLEGLQGYVKAITSP